MPLTIPSAYPTLPTAFMEICVGCVVRMPIWAMSLGTIVRSEHQPKIAAPDVFLVGDRLQMFRVCAVAYPAQMIDRKTLWNWPNQKLVSKTVGVPHAPIDHEFSVASGYPCSRPQPARTKIRSVSWDRATLINSRPKSLFRSTLNLHRILHWFGVMRQGVFAPLPPSIVTNGVT